MNRRRFLRDVSLAGVGAAVVQPMATIGCQARRSGADRESKPAERLIESAPVVEMLGGFMDELHFRDGKLLTHHWFERPASVTEDDYRFIRSSGIDIFAIGELVQDRHDMILRLACWNGFLISNSRYFERIDTTSKLLAAGSSRKVGVLLTFQDSRHIETVADVELFYVLGQRVAQLTYNDSNRLGCGAFVDTDTGLTKYGTEIVARMNQVGMAVDVSHCGDRTTLDAIEASERPTLVTHASCRALIPGYPRAKTDEAIRKLAASGGVIGIPMLRFMIRDSEPVSIEHYIDHIEHVVQLVGVEHVGVGSDQGLITEDDHPIEIRKHRLANAPAKYEVHTNEQSLIGIEGLNHRMRTYDLAEGLIRRGLSDQQIGMVLGGNFVRVLAEIFND